MCIRGRFERCPEAMAPGQLALLLAAAPAKEPQCAQHARPAAPPAHAHLAGGGGGNRLHGLPGHAGLHSGGARAGQLRRRFARWLAEFGLGGLPVEEGAPGLVHASMRQPAPAATLGKPHIMHGPSHSPPTFWVIAAAMVQVGLQVSPAGTMAGSERRDGALPLSLSLPPADPLPHFRM